MKSTIENKSQSGMVLVVVLVTIMFLSIFGVAASSMVVNSAKQSVTVQSYEHGYYELESSAVMAMDSMVTQLNEQVENIGTKDLMAIDAVMKGLAIYKTYDGTNHNTILIEVDFDKPDMEFNLRCELENLGLSSDVRNKIILETGCTDIKLSIVPVGDLKAECVLMELEYEKYMFYYENYEILIEATSPTRTVNLSQSLRLTVEEKRAPVKANEERKSTYTTDYTFCFPAGVADSGRLPTYLTFADGNKLLDGTYEKEVTYARAKLIYNNGNPGGAVPTGKEWPIKMLSNLKFPGPANVGTPVTDLAGQVSYATGLPVVYRDYQDSNIKNGVYPLDLGKARAYVKSDVDAIIARTPAEKIKTVSGTVDVGPLVASGITVLNIGSWGTTLYGDLSGIEAILSTQAITLGSATNAAQNVTHTGNIPLYVYVNGQIDINGTRGLQLRNVKFGCTGSLYVKCNPSSGSDINVGIDGVFFANQVYVQLSTRVIWDDTVVPVFAGLNHYPTFTPKAGTGFSGVYYTFNSSTFTVTGATHINGGFLGAGDAVFAPTARIYARAGVFTPKTELLLEGLFDFFDKTQSGENIAGTDGIEGEYEFEAKFGDYTIIER